MKREVIFVLVFLLFLQFSLVISAAEETQVELGYSCLESRINQTGCANLNFEEKVFSYLATGDCGSQLSADNLSNRCWPKSSCKIKSTAQAILALNKKADTKDAEMWLLGQTASPTVLDWYLEIEVPDGETTCVIAYPGTSPRTITIREDKTISSNAGNYLTLSAGAYWLKIDSRLYNQEIYIQCEKQFITTLLFTKSGSSTIHVSEEVIGSGAGGNVTQKVDSLCFAQNGVCTYEGSLWAALVLASLDDYDEQIQKFLPYLIAMKDDLSNQIYIPESFLFYLTDKFRTDLLLKQKYSSYWEESGNRYYDTALALLPLIYDNSNEKSNAKSWLLSVQQKSGCWNNGNIRDTAFLLYSVWPKNPFSPVGKCEYNSDCPQVDCKYSWCEGGECVYEYDGSCVEVECSSNSDCPGTEYSENYCGGDSIYRETYTYTCDTSEGFCVVNTKENLVETCSESCEEGACVQEKCSWFNPCGSGYECISNSCVPIQGECEIDSDCEVYNSYSNNFCSDGSTVSKTYYSYYCDSGSLLCYPNADEDILVDECSDSETCDDNSGKCIDEGNTCSWLFNPCDEGYNCVGGVCIPEGECEIDDDCEYVSCMDATCTSGTCVWEYSGCADNDYCCNPGCDYSNDNDCGDEPQCISDSDCSSFNYQTDRFCGGSNWEDVYLTFYNYTCESSLCISSSEEVLIQDCASSQDCYVGECYGGKGEVCDCNYDDDCATGYNCVDCICSSEIPGGACTDWWDCNSDEDCVNGACVPYLCDEDSDCNSGKCVDGICSYETSECEENLYYCRSKASCDANGGNIMQDYSCSGDLLKCCDVDALPLTCAEEGGDICSYDEICAGGTVVDSSDAYIDELCCVGGTCSAGEEEYCTNYGGECRDEGYCGEGESEEYYLCDESYQACCVIGGGSGSCDNDGKCDSGETKSNCPSDCKKGGGWIIIVLLLILIILAVLGIVFRDKVRTEWMKLKDKFNGKKPKKKFELPLTMQPNANRRILPRRILPPGQGPQGPPQQSRFPMRTMGQPVTSPSAAQPSRTANQAPFGKPSVPSQTKPSTSQPSSQIQKPSPTSPAKKPEKPKNGDLDDVLKKLKEMGNKE